MSTETEPVDGHAPIRGMRTMAVVRWILLALVAAVAAGTWWTLALHADHAVQGAPRFYCPMHPQIRSPAPGTCPICFMTLEPIPEERKAQPRVTGSPSSSAARPSPLTPVMLTFERRQAIGIATVPVTRRPIARELRLSAVIEPLEKAVSEVRVRTLGFVERVAPVQTGQTVKPGEALVWLYSPERRARPGGAPRGAAPGRPAGRRGVRRTGRRFRRQRCPGSARALEGARPVRRGHRSNRERRPSPASVPHPLRRRSRDRAKRRGGHVCDARNAAVPGDGSFARLGERERSGRGARDGGCRNARRIPPAKHGAGLRGGGGARRTSGFLGHALRARAFHRKKRRTAPLARKQRRSGRQASGTRAHPRAA